MQLSTGSEEFRRYIIHVSKLQKLYANIFGGVPQNQADYLWTKYLQVPGI